MKKTFFTGLYAVLYINTPHDSLTFRTTFRSKNLIIFCMALSVSNVIVEEFTPVFFITLLQFTDVCRHVFMHISLKVSPSGWGLDF